MLYNASGEREPRPDLFLDNIGDRVINYYDKSTHHLSVLIVICNNVLITFPLVGCLPA